MPRTRKLQSKELSQEQLAEWLEHPVTRMWFAAVRHKAYIMGLNLLDGAALDDSTDKVAMNYYKVVGWRAGLFDALEVDLETRETTSVNNENTED